MNLKLKYLIPAILIGTIFSSCKNDIDVLAPYKESVCVYGLLNPSATTQKIRINKVFLGAGDATVMAQNADSINFPANAITVTLERYVNGVKAATTVGQSKTSITLTETVVTTASGAFNSTQRLYITDDKLFTSGDYKINITDNHNGKNYTAQSVIVDSVHPYNQMPWVHSSYFPNHGEYVYTGANATLIAAYVDYSNPAVTQKIKFKSVANAKIYNVTIRFHYRDSLADHTTSDQFVDLTFPDFKSEGITGNENMELSFDPQQFYTNLANQLNSHPVSNLAYRRCLYMDFIVSAGAQELSDFLQVNAPSTSIAQNKPYYTNISDGVGIFSSRSTSTISKDLSYTFIDDISTNHYTCNLRFLNSSGVWTGICN